MSGTFRKLAWWPAVGFGLGLIPFAPGTFGSLLGPPLVWGVQSFGGPWWGYWGTALVLILLGGPICQAGAERLGVKDPGAVVYDEVVAFFLVFAAVPLTWTTAILGFALFRVFDIAKPWPTRRAEELPGGWGILADDLVAGAYAGAVLWALSAWALPPGLAGNV